MRHEPEAIRRGKRAVEPPAEFHLVDLDVADEARGDEIDRRGVFSLAVSSA